MPAPIDLNSTAPLGPRQIPGFLGDGISTVSKVLDKLDLFENDGLVMAIPFGKLAVFGYKSIRNFKDPAAAIRHSVGTAVGICFGAALRDANVKYELTERDETKFKSDLKTAIAETKVDMKAFQPNRLVQADVSQRFFRLYLNSFDRSDIDTHRSPEARFRPHLETYLQEWLPAVWHGIIERDPDRYAIISDTFESKSRRLSEQVVALKNYQQHLFSLYTTAAGNISNIPLSTLYLRARTQVQTMLLSESKERHDPTAAKFTPAGKADLPDDLHDLVLAWLGLSETPLDCAKLRTTEDPRLLLLYGQPGQGKTSFCKRLLYDLISTCVHYDRPVYFLRLRDIKDVSGLREDPLDHLRKEIESVNDIAIDAADLKRSILILDGMDELAMSNGMTIDSADRLLSGIEDQLKHHPELRIIVTSRHGYLRADDRLHKDFLVLQIADLEREQQEEWLARYQLETGKTTLTAETLEGIKEDSSLGKLLTQPLLLQLVADLPKLPEDTAARAGVYDHIFNHLIETPWKTGQIKTLENLTDGEVQEDFRQALREIAFELFVRGGEALPGKVVNELESVTHLAKQLGRDEAEDGLRLMQVAFYFQDKLDRETGQYAIEFQHKSFGEYLAAEYFYEEVMLRFLEKDVRGRSYRYNGASALTEWHKLASRRPFTREMIHYLIEIIQRDKPEERESLKSELKTRLLDMAEHWFTAGFIDPADTRADYADPVTERGLMSGYLWFVLGGNLNEVSILSKKISSRLASITIIQRLAVSSMPWTFIEGDFSEVSLPFILFDSAIMRSCNFKQANFYQGYFRNSDLRKGNFDDARFTRANLYGCILDHGSFRRTDFLSAYLQYSSFRMADLYGADFVETDLQYVDFSEANLEYVSFTEANVFGLKLSHPNQLLVSRSLYKIKGLSNALLMYIKRYRSSLFLKGSRYRHRADIDDFNPNTFQDANEWDEEKGQWADWWLKECEAAGEEE